MRVLHPRRELLTSKNPNRNQPVSIVRVPGPDEESIRVRAYQMYVKRGMEDGHDLDDWLRAEEEIAQRKTRAAVA
jgi:hypothetical protein